MKNKKDQIKIENPETENSQIPAPLYVNKMGKVETGVANLCCKILRIALQRVDSISFRSCFQVAFLWVLYKDTVFG